MKSTSIEEKTASSIRYGFKYQDLVTLELILKEYIKGNKFSAFLEYRDGKGLDDVVVVNEDSVQGYQIKHAKNNLDNFVEEDFTTSTNKRVQFKKFAQDWKYLRDKYSPLQVICHLISNRSINLSSTDKIIFSNCCFDPSFVENRRRGNVRNFRDALFYECSLEESEFKQFLTAFRFNLNYPSLSKLKAYITDTLLNKELGITEKSVFHDLLQIVQNHAVDTHAPITPLILDEAFKNVRKIDLLLSQVFPVDSSQVVRLNEFNRELYTKLSEANGEYVVVTGVPGSGKSTSLTLFLDDLGTDSNFLVVKYYCFVGITDNLQKLRLEAEALRANILTQLQRQFSAELNGRFDYGDKKFIEALEKIGKLLSTKSKKLVVFVDGLDHAERFDGLLQSVQEALPQTIPENVVFLIGTQELKNWQPLTLKKGRKQKHITMPLLQIQEVEIFLQKREINLEKSDIELIFERSGGHPLYLVYVAQHLVEEKIDIADIPFLQDGMITNYYEVLWKRFERENLHSARYLSGVISALKFPVHIDKLENYQDQIQTSEFPNCFREVNHLLRSNNSYISVFHDSFRVFVDSKFSTTYKQKINQGICNYLKKMEGSRLWLEHVIQYAVNADDADYVFATINREFVDLAMENLVPGKSIQYMLELAMRLAIEKENWREIARIGTIRFRTHARLEYNLENEVLVETQIYLRNSELVKGYIRSPESGRWLVEDSTVFTIARLCIRSGLGEMGKEIYHDLLRDNKHIALSNVTLTNYSFCLGYCSDESKKHLGWLGKNKISNEMLIDRDYFTPLFAPDLESYLEGVIATGDLNRLAKIENDNGLLEHYVRRFYVIRTLAAENMMSTLPKRLRAYVDNHPEQENLELAFYAALCGLPAETIKKLAGQIPLIEQSNVPSETDHKCTYEFMKLFYLGAIIAAEKKSDAFHALYEELNTNDSFWNSGKRFMVTIGTALITKSRESVNDALNILAKLDRKEGERVVESLSGLRACLPIVFRHVVRLFDEMWPEELMTLINRIRELRHTYLWITHYGIGNYTEDYNFELQVWDLMTDVVSIRHLLFDLLNDCASTYSESIYIRGGSRCSHFLSLAAIAAKCGFRDSALAWIKQAIQATNIYGDRNDMTLLNLGSVLEITSQYNAEQSHKRIGRLFELVRWLPSVTDGKGTKWIPEEIFKILLGQDKAAAMKFLVKNQHDFARWQLIDCVVMYISSIDQGDEEFLWAFCETISNEFREPGRHPENVIRARRKVVEIAVKNGCDRSIWEERLANWIMTSITSLRWPEDIWKKTGDAREKRQLPESKSSQEYLSSEGKYRLYGVELATHEIVEKCKESFEVFVSIMDRINSENANGYFRDIQHEVLTYYVSSTTSLKDSRSVYNYISNISGLGYSNKILNDLAATFQRFGNIDEACDCWRLAYKWQYETENSTDNLKKIGMYSRDTVKKAVLEKIISNLDKGWESSSIVVEIVNCLNIIEEPEYIPFIIEDYFQHCEELFDHVPDEKEFDWLEEHNSKEELAEDYILDFLLKKLEMNEVSVGYKLAKATADLVVKRSKIFIKILSYFNKDSNPWRKMRLLWIIRMVAQKCPEIVRNSWEILWEGQNSWNFHISRTIEESMIVAFRDCKMPIILKQCLDRIENKRSHKILYSSYWHNTKSPSNAFSLIYKKGCLWLQYIIKATSEILDIPLNTILAEIEEKLVAIGWNENDAKKQLEDERHYCAHPQGWPFLFIYPTMYMLVRDKFYYLMKEILNNNGFDSWQIDSIKRITQEIDPEVLVHPVMPRPSGILPLVVDDEKIWLSDNKSSTLRYLSIDRSQEWVTIYQFDNQKLDTPYEIPFEQQFILCTILIESKKLINGVPDVNDYIQRVGYHLRERFTLLQFEDWVLNTPENFGNNLFSEEKLLAIKHCPLGFEGYSTLVSLSSMVINDFGLMFRDHDLYEGNKQVTKLEMWQEGYVDDDYSDEILSYGTRLQVNVDILHRISLKYGLSVYQDSWENRKKYSSRYDKNPEKETEHNKSFMIEFTDNNKVT